MATAKTKIGKTNPKRKRRRRKQLLVQVVVLMDKIPKIQKDRTEDGNGGIFFKSKNVFSAINA